jgi:hypothetical protein
MSSERVRHDLTKAHGLLTRRGPWGEWRLSDRQWELAWLHARGSGQFAFPFVLLQDFFGTDRSHARYKGDPTQIC